MKGGQSFSLQNLFSSPSSFSSMSSSRTSCFPAERKRRRVAATRADVEEIRVCTNRTCRRQGSLETLQNLTGLAPPDISVKSCGCLGSCGAGPNVAVLPKGVVVTGCGTAARAAQLMIGAANVTDGAAASKALEALALRKIAEAELKQSNFSQAELLLSQAISLNPFGGIHIMYKCRSLSRLAMGNHSGALDDAREALKLAPQYPEAYLCEGDALLAMGEYNAAENSYSMCLHVDPSVRRSNSFKTRVAKLLEKLTAVNMPPWSF